MALRPTLATLRAGNVISEEQYDTLLGLMSGKTLSLYWEIRALFYVGVLAVVAGAGSLIKENFAQLGPAAITAALTIASIACYAYCWRWARPYSRAEQISPTPAFDYLLYAGCALFSLDMGALATQFPFWTAHWSACVLGGAILFFALAYRFDNRLVLTLALTSLAAWCGIKIRSRWFFGPDLLRPFALAYGAAVAAGGLAMARLDIKKHFLDIYLNIAAHVLFIALLAGLFSSAHESLYGLGLALCCAAALTHGIQARRFLYVFYAIAYGYVGLSVKIVSTFHEIGSSLAYLIVSSVAVLTVIVMVSRRFKERA
jgi:hypothetical protein